MTHQLMLTKFPLIVDRIIEWGIIFLLVSTPLALPTRYGTVHLWVYTGMELTIFLLIIIWALKQIINILGLCSAEHTSPSRNPWPRPQGGSHQGRPKSLPDPSEWLVRADKRQVGAIRKPQSDYNRFGFAKTPLNIPIMLFVGLIIFQLIPLPPGILKSVSPNAYQLYKTTLPGWLEEEPFSRKSQSSNGNSSNDSLASTNQISNTESLAQTAGRFAPGQAEIPARQTAGGRNPWPRPKDGSHQGGPKSKITNWRPLSIYPYATKSELIKILAYIGMFFLVANTPFLRINRIIVIILCVGFFISFLGILQKLTGTNKVYWLIDYKSVIFGSFVNRNHFAGYVGMVIPLAFGLLISRFGSITFHKTMTWRSILTKFESHLLGNVMFVFAIMIMVSALFLSLSRGGIMSFAVTIIVFVSIVGLSRKTRSIIGKGRMATIATLFLAFVFLMWLGLGPVLERLSDISSPGRHEVSQNTINMAKDFPLFGTGLGTFQYLFPKYKTLERQLFYDHAHNDYVELLSDSGLIGFIIVTGGIIIFIWKILVRWWERRDSFAKGVTLGGFCGIIAILSHSVADFNLHIPANALFLSFILGLTWNAVNLESIHNEV